MKLNKKILVLSALLCLGLGACTGPAKGSSGAEESSAAPWSDPGSESFTEVTEFDDPIDVRTDDQKAFIEYDGDYSQLQQNDFTGTYHTNPNESQSEAKTFEIAFEHDTDKEVKSYEVEISLKNNMEDAWSFPCKDKKATIQNLFIGSTYYYRVKANIEGEEPEYSFVKTLETVDAAPRIVNIDGMTNCRDLGGKMTASGAKIRQGLLYRTASLDDSQSQSIITDTGRNTARKYLGMKTEIDLRGGPNGTGGEGSGSFTGSSKLDAETDYKFIPFAYSNGKDNLFRNIIPVRRFFETLATPEAFPAFFHCRIGTDRTGLCATLLNGLLGLSLQEIYQDYLFSNFGRIGKTSTVGQANEDGIAGYVNELAAFDGDTLQERIYNFLLTIGVKEATLENILDVMLEGPKPELNAKKINVTHAEQFTLDGASIVDSTEFRSPEKAAKLSTGNKISYTFTSSKAVDTSITAMMTCKNTSSNLASALKVKLDGTELSLYDTSFATNKLGFGTNDEYWEPAKLVDGVALSAASHTIEVENLFSADIKITDMVLTLGGDTEIALA